MSGKPNTTKVFTPLGRRVRGWMIAGIMATRAFWLERQRQATVRTKLVSTAVFLVFLAVLWLRVTVYHNLHPHESWVLPLLWTLSGAYFIWNQFRRPGSSPLK